MSAYLSVAATLEAAQARLDEHPLGLDGLCRRCRVDGQTCVERRSALAVFTEYRCLPRRLPGASRAGVGIHSPRHQIGSGREGPHKSRQP